VLESYFNLTSKSIHINRYQYVLIRIFHHLVVAYCLGHPVYNYNLILIKNLKKSKMGIKEFLVNVDSELMQSDAYFT